MSWREETTSVLMKGLKWIYIDAETESARASQSI